MAENEKLFWNHLQHQICLTLNNSNVFYTWAHTWLGTKRPQSLSLTMYTPFQWHPCGHSSTVLYVLGPSPYVLCAHSFSCMFLIWKGYIQNFSLCYAAFCLFEFVNWVFTMSPRLMSNFWSPCDSSDSTSEITAQARVSTSGFRQLLWKPLRSTSWTFICACVG